MFWIATDPPVTTTSTSPVDVGILPNLPPIYSILIGECVYNLRAALDYLVYELSLLDYNGKVVGRIPQFIIEDEPTTWRTNKWRLKFMSAKHQGMLKRLQPFKGCDWQVILRELSNPDKHRTLAVVTSQKVTFVPPWPETIPPPMYTATNMEGKLIFHVAFDDGSRVIETLQELVSEVANVLNMFNPEF